MWGVPIHSPDLIGGKLEIKICSKCKRELPINNFYQRSDGKKRHYTVCKSCWHIHSRNYFLTHLSTVNEARRQWSKLNKDKIKEKDERYKLKYPDRNKELKKRQHEINKNNIFLKINGNISTAIWRTIKGNKNGKHYETILGYKLQDLIKHLESKFKPGMAWGNYGRWHIDHIIPISLWEFESYQDREFKQCWALCNLQPLWARENIAKKNKI